LDCVEYDVDVDACSTKIPAGPIEPIPEYDGRAPLERRILVPRYRHDKPGYGERAQPLRFASRRSRSIIESHHGRFREAPGDCPEAAFSFSIPFGPEGAASAMRKS
jgi:hypothetical protein